MHRDSPVRGPIARLYWRMKIPTRLILLCAGLALLPLPRAFAHSQSQSAAGSSLLSASDRKAALTASRIGVRSPRQARTWLRRQRTVALAQMGRDGQTLDVHFRDGAELALLPRAVHRATLRTQASQLRPLVSAHDTPAGKAIVLEPFADELGLGANAG